MKNHAGEAALIQRCQVHKRRNVLDHLPEDQKSLAATKLNAAYAMGNYDAAKAGVEPAATRVDGPESERGEAVWRKEWKKLSPCIGSRFLCNCARRWPVRTSLNLPLPSWKEYADEEQGGDQRERWVGSGLLVAEKQFWRVKGHKLIPLLLRQLDALSPKSPKIEVVKRKKAS